MRVVKIKALERAYLSRQIKYSAYEEIHREADKWFMRVPADADGVPIRVGDLVTDPDGIPLEVEAVGEECVFLCNEDGVTREFALAGQCHQYYKPMVEDVLREFLSAVDEALLKGYDDAPTEVYAEYAAKLRLADE